MPGTERTDVNFHDGSSPNFLLSVFPKQRREQHKFRLVILDEGWY